MLRRMGSETSALEIVTVVIAGYAALVGTLALAFQAISWLRSWSTRVEVSCGRYDLVSVGEEPETVVLIRMINHSMDEAEPVESRPGSQGGSPGPTHRFRILKLLDDDFLRSAMTDHRHEVNPKTDPPGA
jgi:hypothetical protein